jgi:hypothetical protein
MVSSTPATPSNAALAAWKAKIAKVMAASGLGFRAIAAAMGKKDHTSVMRCINGERRPSIAMIQSINVGMGRELGQHNVGLALNMVLATEMPELFEIIDVDAFLQNYLECVFAGRGSRAVIIDAILQLSPSECRSLIAGLNDLDWFWIEYALCDCRTREAVIDLLRSSDIDVGDTDKECLYCAGGTRLGLTEAARAFNSSVCQALRLTELPDTVARELTSAACHFLRDIANETRQQENRIDDAYAVAVAAFESIEKSLSVQSPKDRAKLLADAHRRLGRLLNKERYIRGEPS